jgi:alkylation response protein AidB-like acyl-CoA dehydrogenase
LAVAWQVGGLTGGRVLIAQGAVDGAKVALAIAIRYACMRPQFENKLIITYLTHQRRLLPGLATTYALQLALLRVKVRFLPYDCLLSSAPPMPYDSFPNGLVFYDDLLHTVWGARGGS